ncbi:MAG: TNT domain-containing protein [Candidatus Nanopelagicales bacterium]
MSPWLQAGVAGIGLSVAVLCGAATAHADRGDTSTAPSRAEQAASAGKSATSHIAHRASRAATNHRVTTAPPATVRVPAPKASVTPTSAPWQPGPVISIFISDGTATHPDAGLLVGNGFSFTATSCPTSTQCDGGHAGYLYGNGGNGFNGGNGGSAGFVGNGGGGGAADRFTPGGSGGNGGSAGLFLGNGGDGGNASTGANGGVGGAGGMFLGLGGRGGVGGPGAMTCSEQQQQCIVITVGGIGGSGGSGGLFFGRNGGDGAAPLHLDSLLFVGYAPVYPVFAPSPPYPPDTNEINGTNGNGAVYPNDDDPAKPYAIPGTVVSDVQLPTGLMLGRWGYPGGSYLTPGGTYLAQASLPPSGLVAPYFQFMVANPSALPAGFSVEQSQAASWFGQPGGGIQYRVIGPNGRDAPVQALLDSGFLSYA